MADKQIKKSRLNNLSSLNNLDSPKNWKNIN